VIEIMYFMVNCKRCCSQAVFPQMLPTLLLATLLLFSLLPCILAKSVYYVGTTESLDKVEITPNNQTNTTTILSQQLPNNLRFVIYDEDYYYFLSWNITDLRLFDYYRLPRTDIFIPGTIEFLRSLTLECDAMSIHIPSSDYAWSIQPSSSGKVIWVLVFFLFFCFFILLKADRCWNYYETVISTGETNVIIPASSITTKSAELKHFVYDGTYIYFATPEIKKWNIEMDFSSSVDLLLAGVDPEDSSFTPTSAIFLWNGNTN